MGVYSGAEKYSGRDDGIMTCVPLQSIYWRNAVIYFSLLSLINKNHPIYRVVFVVSQLNNASLIRQSLPSLTGVLGELSLVPEGTKSVT